MCIHIYTHVHLYVMKLDAITRAQSRPTIGAHATAHHSPAHYTTRAPAARNTTRPAQALTL